MSPNMFGLVLVMIIAAAQAAVFLNNDNKAILQRDSFGKYVILPNELEKLKRSFGRNCMFTITGCFTSSQAERYRKYMENVRFIPSKEIN